MWRTYVHQARWGAGARSARAPRSGAERPSAAQRRAERRAVRYCSGAERRRAAQASDPPRRGNSSAPQTRQLFQAADGGDLVGHHLVALNSWDASTVQPKRFLRRRPSLPTTRMRRWLCWGSSATHRPWHTPEAGTVQMLSVFVVGRACVVSKGPSVSSKVWELSLSRCSRINTPPVTPNSETRK